MVSKARLDLPDPERPVKTISESRGRSSEMSLRLCSRAPRMMSWSATGVLGLESSGGVRSNTCSPARAAGASLTRPTDSPILRGRGRPHLTRIAPTQRPGPVVLDGSMEERRTTETEIAAGLLGDASGRLLRTVDGFHGDGWSAPSGLPGWSRAHLVAHLALNAEALTRVLHRLVGDHAEPPTMYDSDEQRDDDIRDLATADHSEIRDRLLAGTAILDDAIAAVPGELWGARAERTPGGRTMRADSLPGMRLRELEIHHADLDAGYSRSDWSQAFAILLLNAMAKRLDPPARIEVRPDDVDGRTWILGPNGDGPRDGIVVTGPAADLGWWLTGRPAPDTLQCSRGELPPIEGW